MKPSFLRWLAMSLCLAWIHTGMAAELASARIAEITSWLPPTPRGLGPVCADRPAWSAVVASGRVQGVVAAADKLLGQPFPSWDDDAYREFSRNGQRVRGERMMNARKAWLLPLVLAECLQWDGRYREALATTLRELATQPSWSWPAHDKSLRNLRGDYEVDLFAADLAHELAQALYMLGDRVDEATRQQVVAALEQRVFAPMRRSFASGRDHWWLKADHNWNAVCLKGVVAAALTLQDSREERALFAAAGEHYIRRYVEGFAADGYTTEGPGYWNYGVSHFAELHAALWQASGGRIDLFAEEPAKVRAIALYGVRIEMRPGNSAAFSDASPTTRMDDFTRAYTNEVLGLGLPFRLAALPVTPQQAPNNAPLATAALLLSAAPPARVAPPSDEPGLRSYFDQVGVLVTRPREGGRLAASIKAGGNGNHSHNDIGSYAIGLGSEQPVGDVGRPQYTARTFGRERYSIRAINSYGHPVPLVAGTLQREATTVKPQVLVTRFGDEADSIEIDLASAYAVPALRNLTRQLRHDRAADAISIEDRFRFDSPQAFELAITTLGSWRRREDGLLEFRRRNESLLARIEASASFDLVEERIDEEGLSFTRLAVRLREPATEGFVRLHYTPTAR
ncbi:MAG: hypothetical protein REI94_15810 [Moraxellaceae bacterium]|nr:hypothetical protein [Moraxellaceae bacterium]